jgi:hypothetical protein
MIFDALLQKLEGDMRADLERTVTGFVATARTQLEGALAAVAIERAKGLADVAKEKADLHREIAAMHKHKEAQEGRVVLNIGGYRYTTSVQTLRRIPHTFFDAYFSGRYAMTGARTAASSSTVTASTLGRCWSTCATACYRWRSRTLGIWT